MSERGEGWLRQRCFQTMGQKTGERPGKIQTHVVVVDLHVYVYHDHGLGLLIN